MSRYHNIEVDELAWMINKNIIDAIIDVRPKKVFYKGHIKKSRNFPCRQFENYLPNIFDFIESGVSKIVVISEGNKEDNSIVYNALSRSGYSDIVFVNFNISDWKDVGGVVKYGNESHD